MTFFFFENDVNVASKSNKEKVPRYNSNQLYIVQEYRISALEKRKGFELSQIADSSSLFNFSVNCLIWVLKKHNNFSYLGPFLFPIFVSAWDAKYSIP